MFLLASWLLFEKWGKDSWQTGCHWNLDHERNYDWETTSAVMHEMRQFVYYVISFICVTTVTTKTLFITLRLDRLGCASLSFNVMMMCTFKTTIFIIFIFTNNAEDKKFPLVLQKLVKKFVKWHFKLWQMYHL